MNPRIIINSAVLVISMMMIAGCGAGSKWSIVGNYHEICQNNYPRNAQFVEYAECVVPLITKDPNVSRGGGAINFVADVQRLKSMVKQGYLTGEDAKIQLQTRFKRLIFRLD